MTPKVVKTILARELRNPAKRRGSSSRKWLGHNGMENLPFTVGIGTFPRGLAQPTCGHTASGGGTHFGTYPRSILTKWLRLTSSTGPLSAEVFLLRIHTGDVRPYFGNYGGPAEMMERWANLSDDCRHWEASNRRRTRSNRFCAAKPIERSECQITEESLDLPFSALFKPMVPKV